MMEGFYAKHDSQNIAFRRPFGAVNPGKELTIRLQGEDYKKVSLELIYLMEDNEASDYINNSNRKTLEMNKREEAGVFIYETSFNIDKEFLGIINYYFSVTTGEKVIYYGNKEDGLGGEGRLYYDNPIPYQITVYKEFYVPSWYKEGLVYQIFVDRFRNGNRDGKVSNPKPNSFLYGSWDDEPMYIRAQDGRVLRWDFYGGNLQGVIEKLKYLSDLGVTVIYCNPIFEAVSNHKYDTGDYKRIDPMFGDDLKFMELCDKAKDYGIRIILDGVFSHTGADSRYFNKFGHYDSLGAYQSQASPYYSWYRFEEYPEKYQCWWGIDNQPNVEELNEDYRRFIIGDKNSVISKWMSLGASGWRLDVADELPDEFIKELKLKARELDKKSILIGEIWEDASNKVSYSKRRRYLLGEELDSVTNYPLRINIIDFLNEKIGSSTFIRNVMSLYENYPKEAFYANLNVLGTHDTERILTALKGDINKLSMAIAIQMTMPGVPLIYYGDEVGVTGGVDPLNRKTYPWGKENIKVFEIYKKFIALRNSKEAFKKGKIVFYPEREHVLCFERRLNEESTFIMINRSNQDKVHIDLDLKDNKGISVDLAPWEIKII